MNRNPAARQTGSERVLLVGIQWPGMTGSLAQEYLDELDMLARTAGALVAGHEQFRKHRPDPALLLGRGQVAELARIVAESRADLIVFDDDLSPAQARNLEKALDRRVVDRTSLILDIFARRARSREAKTQVELAQLRHLLPRLTRAWTHLERQRGGIGLRGPGETQLETDRRVVRDRIRVLETELKHIDRVRHTQRSGREEMFRFALAGYTNVGKSTLMNALTQAGVYEEDLLFATLDSTTRLIKLGPAFRALLTDTVGFIRKLPTSLIASFRSTLGEIGEAHCVLHVADLSSPSCREQMEEVEKILADMGLADRPRIVVFNKLDAVEDEVPLRWARAHYPEAVHVSARLGTNVPSLLEKMRAVLLSTMVELSVEVQSGDGILLAELHRVAEVLEQEFSPAGLRLRVRLPGTAAARLKLFPGRDEG